MPKSASPSGRAKARTSNLLLWNSKITRKKQFDEKTLMGYINQKSTK